MSHILCWHDSSIDIHHATDRGDLGGVVPRLVVGVAPVSDLVEAHRARLSDEGDAVSPFVQCSHNTAQPLLQRTANACACFTVAFSLIMQKPPERLMSPTCLFFQVELYMHCTPDTPEGLEEYKR